MYNDLGAIGMQAWVEQYQMGDEIDFVLSKVRENSRVVLDLGCGYGRTAVPLAARGFEVHGIDISENLIASAHELARQHNVTAQFAVGDMCELPYDDCTFDQVLCLWSSFIHIVDEAEQLRCMNEVHRVLKPGGTAIFVLTDPALDYWKERLENAPGRVVLFEVVEGHSVPVFIHNTATVKVLMTASAFNDYKFAAERCNEKERLVLSAQK